MMQEQKQYDQGVLLAELKIDMQGMKEDFKSADRKLDILLDKGNENTKKIAVLEEQNKGQNDKIGMLYKILGTGAVIIAGMVVETISSRI